MRSCDRRSKGAPTGSCSALPPHAKMASGCMEICRNSLLRGGPAIADFSSPASAASCSSSSTRASASASARDVVLVCGRRAAASRRRANCAISCSASARNGKDCGGLLGNQFVSHNVDAGSSLAACGGQGWFQLTRRVRDESRSPRHGARRGVVTMVIPFQRGDATQQPPPDLPSYLFKNRIVFLGMSLVPSVTELIMAELLYLQYEDPEKPIYMYINSTGTTKDGEKLGYETEAFAIYDTMRYVKPPIFTLCVGNAWGEAALLLAAGSKGNRASLPSSTIMIKQPIAQFRGQATDIDIARREVRNVKNELLDLLSRHLGHSTEKIEEDIKRPRYFSPEEAIDYGIIDKVLYSDKGEDKSIVSDFKKAQLI